MGTYAPVFKLKKAVRATALAVPAALVFVKYEGCLENESLVDSTSFLLCLPLLLRFDKEKAV